MKAAFLPMLLLSLAAAQAQQPDVPLVPLAPPATTPPAEEPVPSSIPKNQQLLEYGSFELPRVKGRAPKDTGGNFLLFARDEWVKFEPAPLVEGKGEIVVGLSTEVARTGRQSLYVQFNKVARPSAEAVLVSELLHVHPKTPYRVAIWGQVDKKNPVTTAMRIPALRCRVDYFQEDMQTQVKQDFTVQPMPGVRGKPPLFVPNRWSEYFMDIKTTEETHYVRITWSWVTTPDDGVTNGTMFFDDAMLVGERVEPEEPAEDAPEVSTPAKPAMEEKPKPEELLDLPDDAPAPVPKSATPPAATPAVKKTP